LELSLSPDAIDEFNEMEKLEREMSSEPFLNELPAQDIT